MCDSQRNYYGSLCTKMYEILHAKAPQDELEFYLSYAAKNMKILEPLCGNGRFLIPFSERGFDICGMDLSKEMLAELTRKAPNARVTVSDIESYQPGEQFDYIFIPSGSVSLFTDIPACKEILKKIKGLLHEGGRFAFAVDTVATKCPDDADYKTSVSVKTAEGYDLASKGQKPL